MGGGVGGEGRGGGHIVTPRGAGTAEERGTRTHTHTRAANAASDKHADTLSHIDAYALSHTSPPHGYVCVCVRAYALVCVCLTLNGSGFMCQFVHVLLRSSSRHACNDRTYERRTSETRT